MQKHVLKLWCICVLAFAAIILSGAALVTQSLAVAPKISVLMYHHLTKDPARVGPYTILVDTFESDLIYLRENGYEAITVAQLIAHMDEGVPLPKKPVLLTFDDGNESVFAYAFPLLEQYNMKASVAIVGAYTDLYTQTEDHNLAYSYMTWSQVQQLQESGLIEIQNHTYNLHQNDEKRNGSKINPGEAPAAYTELLAADLGALQEAIYRETGWRPNAFAYPFGFYCEESLPVLKELGFRVAFTCESCVNLIPEQSADILLLGRVNRPGTLTTEDFFQRIK